MNKGVEKLLITVDSVITTRSFQQLLKVTIRVINRFFELQTALFQVITRSVNNFGFPYYYYYIRLKLYYYQYAGRCRKKLFRTREQKACDFLLKKQ